MIPAAPALQAAPAAPPQGGFRLLPESASTLSGQTDLIYFVLIGLSLLAVLTVAGLIVVFCVRYRASASTERGEGFDRPLRIEWGWTLALLVLFFAVFGWAAAQYARLYAGPADVLAINGIGKQWMWKFQHPGGQREINTLHVPVGRPVRVTLASQDVIHSFYVPAFRVKQDAVPGMYTSVWFEATRTGTYHLFCAEYCGTGHSRMRGSVVVMEPEDYAEWLAAGDVDDSLAAQGERLYRSYGCSGCHGEGGVVRAPSFHGLYGRPVPLQAGGTVVADERYLRDSILMPEKDVVAGYSPVMPSFDGLIGEEDLLRIIAYLKSLSAGQREGESP